TKVVLSSDASDLVETGDTLGLRDVFFTDLTAGTIRYVTCVPAGEANGRSSADHVVSISADRRWVAFSSEAANLVDGANNGCSDVFVMDRDSGRIVRVSVSYSGGDANGDSASPALSADGRYVVFHSLATNLVGWDANGAVADVFRVDRDPDGNGIFDEGNSTTIVVGGNSAGVQGNGSSLRPTVTADGNRIAFDSVSTNLDPIDTSPIGDIFVRDVNAATTQIISFDHSTYASGGDGNSIAAS